MPLKTGIKKHDYDSAWHLFMAGADLEEVARMCDIPKHTLKNYSANHFWAKRRANAIKHARKAVTDDLHRRIEDARVKHQKFMLDQLDHTAGHIENTDIGNDKDSGQISVEAKLNMLDQQDRIVRRVTGMDNEEKRDPVELGYAMLVAMSKGLVNENDDPPVIDMEAERIPMPSKIVFKEPEQISETSESAQDTQTPPQDALAGILSPFNGQLNTTEEPQNTPESEQSEEPGPTGQTQEPTQQYKAPTHLVNENEDQTTDE